MSKSFQEVCKVGQKMENTVQPVRGSSSHSFAMTDVNHEASTLHVFVRDESERLFVEMSLMEIGNGRR